MTDYVHPVQGGSNGTYGTELQNHSGNHANPSTGFLYNLLQNSSDTDTYIDLGNTTADTIIVTVGGVEAMRVVESGGTVKIGVGTPNPVDNLRVEEKANGANVTLSLRALTDAAAGRTFYFTGDPDARSLAIGENGELVIKEDSVGIGMTPVKALDVTGEIRASTGILFGTDTAAANTLDDYEEGTWEATATCSTSGTITLSAATCLYTKVGRLVNCTGRLVVGSVSSPAGQLRISLPFTAQNGESLSQGSVALNLIDFDDNAVHISTEVAGNVAYFRLAETLDNGSLTFVSASDVSGSGDEIRFSLTYNTAT